MFSEKPKSIRSVTSDGLTKYLQTPGALEVIRIAQIGLVKKIGFKIEN